jgi:hypothetical protein
MTNIAIPNGREPQFAMQENPAMCYGIKPSD